jgi:hypothetical protein
MLRNRKRGQRHAPQPRLRDRAGAYLAAPRARSVLLQRRRASAARQGAPVRQLVHDGLARRPSARIEQRLHGGRVRRRGRVAGGPVRVTEAGDRAFDVKAAARRAREHRRRGTSLGQGCGRPARRAAAPGPHMSLMPKRRPASGSGAAGGTATRLGGRSSAHISAPKSAGCLPALRRRSSARAPAASIAAVPASSSGPARLPRGGGGGGGGGAAGVAAGSAGASAAAASGASATSVSAAGASCCASAAGASAASAGGSCGASMRRVRF